MKPFRTEKVASEIRNLVSEAILVHLQDPRIAPLTSVTRVDVSGDLENAKVHVSVLGPEPVQRRTLQALRHARGFVQTHVARSLSIRQCPHLDFELDLSIKRQAEISALIDEAMAELGEAPGSRSAEAADPTEGDAP